MSSASMEPRRRPLGRGRRASHILLFFAAIASVCLVAPHVVAGTSYLFATAEACVASGRFSRQGCAHAFGNSLIELRERIARFPARWKCEAKYRLCEKDSGDEEAYRPTLLGVEIMTGAAPTVTPILAVETPPRTFMPQPISRAIEPMPHFAVGFAPILPAGRFHAKAKGAAEEASQSIDEEMVDIDASPPREDAGPARRESSAARRQRLRAAPFVE